MKQAIINLLAKEVKLKKPEIESLIEVPPNSEFGDYAFPCFILAKKQKKNPIEIAANLKSKLKLTKDIQKIEVKGPYLNFFINKKTLAVNILKNINKKPKKQNRKILIEHTSINPNASPHVGRIRNSLIGDSIKRILQYQGNKIKTHYYVNDVSKQVAILTLSKKIKKFSDLLSEYIRLSKKPDKDKQLFEILKKLEQGDKKTKAKFKKIVNIAVKGQKKILEDIDINFDYFDYESSYLKEQKKILQQLKKTKKLFKDKQGRQVLNQSNQGLEKKMKAPYLVLTRADNTGLYPLRDIAYTIYKMKKTKDNIIILGEDQKLYFEQLKIALKFLKQKAPKPVHYSFVLIQTKKGKGKMSTRKGNLVLFEDFINEAIKKAKKEIKKRKTKGDAKKVAIAAVKYAILKNSPDKNIIFNLEQALSFEGDTGPYLLYSYARASSILRKAKFKAGKKILDLKEQEINLIKKLSQFSEIAEKASLTLNPALIANYSFQLAQIFNEFYHFCPVIKSRQKSFRLSLVQAFRIVMKNSLSLLGVEVLEEM